MTGDPLRSNRWIKTRKCYFHRPRCACDYLKNKAGVQIDMVGDGAAADDKRCCDLRCREGTMSARYYYYLHRRRRRSFVRRIVVPVPVSAVTVTKRRCTRSATCEIFERGKYAELGTSGL